MSFLNGKEIALAWHASEYCLFSKYGFQCAFVFLYKKDFFIDLSGIKENEHIKIFHSGTVMQNSKIKAIGGRILSVNVYSENKEKAVKKAYNAIEAIRCYEDEEFSVENNDYVFYREDIGQ